MPEKALACAFVAGLPDAVRWILRAGTRLESLTLEEMLQRTRMVMEEDRDDAGAVAVGRSRGGFVVRGQQRRPGDRNFVCFECGEPNHIARNCSRRRNRGVKEVRCYRCNRIGHRASDCAGNEDGEDPCAPASSPQHA